MLNRIKYWLFRHLMVEICEESLCLNCRMHHGRGCLQADIYHQARKVWKI